MAVNKSKRKGNVKNIRSHALNSTKKRQNVNLQVHRLEDGTKVVKTKKINPKPQKKLETKKVVKKKTTDE